MAYAARNPGRVRKLVLVNSFAAGWRVRGDPEEIAWRNSLDGNEPAASGRSDGACSARCSSRYIFLGADLEVIDWHNQHFPEFGPVPRLEAMIQLAADIDVRDELKNIRAQTLVCHAKQDGNAPLHAGKAVAEAIEGARFVELESANHILLANEPAWQIFVREARAFLKAT